MKLRTTLYLRQAGLTRNPTFSYLYSVRCRGQDAVSKAPLERKYSRWVQGVKTFETKIKMTRTIKLILTIATLMTSCEGRIEISGTIMSADNNSPIDSAMIQFHEKRNRFTTVIDTVYTDSNGTFQFGRLSMCAPNCPEVKLIISKNGYDTLVKSYEEGLIRDSLTIKLKRTRI